MPKNKHAQALGKRGGSVTGGAKAEASRKNLEKVSPASRIANAEKARAARAAKRITRACNNCNEPFTPAPPLRLESGEIIGHEDVLCQGCRNALYYQR
jgi:RNase P subunit RPR2